MARRNRWASDIPEPKASRTRSASTGLFHSHRLTASRSTRATLSLARSAPRSFGLSPQPRPSERQFPGKSAGLLGTECVRSRSAFRRCDSDPGQPSPAVPGSMAVFEPHPPWPDRRPGTHGPCATGRWRCKCRRRCRVFDGGPTRGEGGGSPRARGAEASRRRSRSGSADRERPYGRTFRTTSLLRLAAPPTIGLLGVAGAPERGGGAASRGRPAAATAISGPDGGGLRAASEGGRQSCPDRLCRLSRCPRHGAALRRGLARPGKDDRLLRTRRLHLPAGRRPLSGGEPLHRLCPEGRRAVHRRQHPPKREGRAARAVLPGLGRHLHSGAAGEGARNEPHRVPASFSVVIIVNTSSRSTTGPLRRS